MAQAMTRDLPDRVLLAVDDYIRRYDLFHRDETVVAGVSGGADSLCLMDALRRLGYRLHVAHLNHGLRPAADDDARFVATLAEGFGLPVTVERLPVKEYAVEHRLSIEEAARVLRYRFLSQTASVVGSRTVAVGHTAGDQVETVLMHFLRGAGLAGLRGMRPKVALSELRLGVEAKPDVSLVRPLLGVRREDTAAYCRIVGLEPRADASNLDTTIFRNRLRHELLPFLATFNPRIDEVILRTAQVAASDHDVLDALTEDAFRRTLKEATPSSIRLDRAELINRPLGLQRGILRRAIASLRPGLRDIDFGPVEQAVEFVERPPQSGRADLTSGLMMQVSGAEVVLREWSAEETVTGIPQLPPGPAIRLAVPGEARLGDSGWVVESVEAPDGWAVIDGVRQNDDPWTVFFDADEIRGSLVFRDRRPGDRIRPLGMDGHEVKVSDLMINVKIPRAARDRWPVLVAGEEVLWVPGARQSEAAKVTGQTRRVTRVRLVKR